MLYLDALSSRDRESTWQKELHTLRDKWDPTSYISSLLGSPGLLAESQHLPPGVSPSKCYPPTQGGLWSPKGRVSSDSTGNGDRRRRVLTASCGPKMPTLLKCDLDFPDFSRDCQTCPLPWDRVRATRRLQTPLPRSFNPIHRHSQAGSLARERCFNIGHLMAPTVVFLRRDPLAKAPLLSLVSGAAWTLLKEGDLLRCPLRGPSNRAPQRLRRGFPWQAP